MIMLFLTRPQIENMLAAYQRLSSNQPFMELNKPTQEIVSLLERQLRVAVRTEGDAIEDIAKRMQARVRAASGGAPNWSECDQAYWRQCAAWALEDCLAGWGGGPPA